MKNFYISQPPLKPKAKFLFRNHFFSNLILTLLFFIGSFASYGQALLEWNTFGNLGTETSEPSVTNNGNLLPSSLTFGAGVTPASNGNRFGGSAWFDTGDTNPTTLTESVTGNDYIEFTITPKSGTTFTPTSFVFNWDRSGTGASNVTLRSSADGYVSDLGTVSGIVGGAFASNSITISGLTNLGTTTFRLYGYGATGTAGTGGFDIGSNVVNVKLNGTITCISGNIVTNTTTLETFCTIQAAIDDAQTLNGHTLVASAGTYDEVVTVNKSLTINGANVGVVGNAPRMPESVLDGNNGAHDGFIVTANNVTIDGFKVTGVAGTYGAGVYSSPTTSGLLMQNNIITDNVIGAYPSSNGTSVVKNNLFDGNNRIGAAGGAGIYVEATNKLTVEGNEFRNHLNNSAVIFTGVAANSHQDLIFTKNFIHDNNNGNSMVYMNGVSNGIFSANTIIQSGTTAIKVAGGNAGISIVNNILDGNTTSVKIEADLIGANTGVEVHNNSLNASDKGINNLDAANVNGTCNWFGGIASVAASKINGLVTYEFFLTSGTDSDLMAVGFQPAVGTCVGCGSGNTVTNTTTMEVFCTIQAAIDDTDTVNGHILTASAGTYDEAVTVNKQLTINGANVGIAGNGVRGAESIVDGNADTRFGFAITVPNVTIDGFKVQNCGGNIYESGIYTNSTGSLIKNNILFSNEKGVYSSNTGATTIESNLFDSNNLPGPAGQVAIYSFTSVDLSILNNEFKGQTANSVVIFDGAANASKHQNIKFNNNYLHDNFQGASAIYAASMANAEFGGNRFTNGNRAIKIAGFNTGVNVHNNEISGTAEADVMVSDDGFGPNSGIQIHNNSLTGLGLSIKNTDITTVDGTCNWYGGTGAAVPPRISGSISFEPFLNSGTDSDIPTAGFQPAMGTCVGCGSGNTVTNTNTGEIFCTIQAAINDTDTVDGHTITISEGTYNEDVNLIKSLTLDGQSRNGTIIKGLYTVGGNATLNIATTAGSGSTIKDLTITRDYGDWYGSTKNYGVLLSGGVNNITIDNVKVTDNRNGIYVENNGQLNLTNSLVERNRTGIHISNTVRGLVTNNIIRDNQTHGVFYNLDDGTSNVSGFEMHDNSITGNWFSEVTFRGANVVSPLANFECNWFGTNSPTLNATNPNETGYAATVPQQLGGTQPTGAYNGQFRGNGAIYIDYTNFRTGQGGNTSDPFIPIGLCNGSSIVIASAVPTPIICGSATGSVELTFSGGLANYTIDWSGAASGNASGITTSPYTITGLIAGAYTITVTDANGTTATTSATILNLPVKNATDNLYFATIQEAIDAPTTADNETIEVCAGTYVGDIFVKKQLTILGPNASIEPCAGTRVAEAILQPSTSINTYDPGFTSVIRIEADNVVIKGFTIDGNNPALTTNVNDAADGIVVETTQSGIIIENNILKNIQEAGVDFFPLSGGTAGIDNVITYNKFENIKDGVYSIGVIIYNDMYAKIDENCMEDVRIGVQTGNFYVANSGTANSISKNNIKSTAIGIWNNLAYSGASAVDIKENVLTSFGGSTDNTGLIISSIQSAVGVNIENNTITDSKYGVELWNNPTTNKVTIKGGSISNTEIGIFANNFETYSSNGESSSYIVDGVEITKASVAGIQSYDSPSNTNNATTAIEVKGNTVLEKNAIGINVLNKDASANIHDNLSSINKNDSGIIVDGGSASITYNSFSTNSVGAIEFKNGGTGNANFNNFYGNGFGVKNSNSSGIIDAKANWWGAVDGPGLVWSGAGDKVSTMVDFCEWLVADATSTTVLADATGKAEVTSLTYSGSPYCQDGTDPSPTLVGSGGGTYSSTMGLTIDATTGIVDLSSSTPGTYTITYSVTASGCSAVSSTASITITPFVGNPGVIVGPVTTCPGTTGLIYTIPPVDGATSYTWTVPADWSITDGATTNSITITAGGCLSTGNITVVANNLCGASATPSTLAVSSVDNVAPVTAANGTATVECLISATAPTMIPTATDACSGSIVGVLESTVDTPSSIDCEGTRVYTYKYVDACGNSSSWTYTYTIKHTTNPKEVGGPVATSGLVQCVNDALPPTILPIVNDVCGNALTASSAIISNLFVTDFSNPITLSATEAADVWYTDRYAPNAFASQVAFGGDTRLEVKINAADGASTRPSNFNSAFYNTQGRAFNVGPNADYIETKLFIPADWATSNKRMAGMWGVALDGSDAVSGYPILEFTSDGNNPRFRAYETGTGVYNDLGLPTGFAYDTWVTLKTTLLPTGEFLYSVGDKAYQTSTSSGDGSVRFKSVILQGHNYNTATLPADPANTGITYNIYWDDLKWNNKIYADPTCEGIINYRYDFKDCAGLVYSWNYLLKIKDTQAPSLTGTPFTQASPTNSCKPTQSAAEATFAEADAKMGYTDNCNPTITVTKISTTFGANDTDCDWTITHTYTLTDECGNTSANLTYQLKGGDDTAPTITLPAVFVSTMPPIVIDGNNNVTVSTPSSGCIIVLPFNKPTNTDNCSGTITAFASAKDKLNNNIFIVDQGSTYLGNFPIGVNTVTFVATDACGNSTSKTITITVVDDVKPIKPTLPNIVACGALTPPTTTDNCSQTVTGTTTQTSYFVEGVYNVVWVFTDASGNSETATQQVTVNGSGAISGTIISDLTPGDGTVNGAAQPTATGFVSIINGTTILATVPVTAGAYTLPSVCNGTYKIVLHTTMAGSTVPQLPIGYSAFVSEGLLGGAADTTPNGIASVTISAGAVVYNNARVAANGDLSFGLNPSSALPVRLVSFTGKSTENGNELTWKASSEANFSHYEVERSTDAQTFKMIGKVNGAGNTNENLSYNFLDDLSTNQGAGMLPGANSSLISHNSSLNYYRLKMIDLDGTIAYSKVIFIDNEIARYVVGEFYPNPAFGTEVSINITSAKANLWTITSYDLAGRIINTETRQLDKGENKLKFETKAKKSGVSIFRFESTDGVQFRKIISQ